MTVERNPSVSDAWPRRLASPAFVLGLACFALHLLANGHYDVFRDELYFIVCGRRPAFGYVDQPPLVPLIAAGSYALFGTALTPLRLVPALAMSATVALSAAFARILGGGRTAQWLCGLAVLLAPVFLVDGLLLVTDILQPLTWLGCSWCLTRVAQTRDERWWIPFGIIVGVSFESKYLIAFYVMGLAVGVVATPLRGSLASRELYIGAAAALAIAAPNLLWQATHGLPFLELARAGAQGKNLALSPLAFLGQQALFLGPVSAPLWVAGLWRLAKSPDPPELRAIPIAYVVMAAFFVATHGKAYYLAPIYPSLFAAGAVAFESWVASRLVRACAFGVLIVAGAAIVPIALPILPPEAQIRYARALGLAPSATAMERGAQSALPQYFADMFGWRNMAAQVAKTYAALPEADRAKAVFFGRNYGEAAAIEIYGPALNGPPAISAHNSYDLWGPDGHDGSVVITLGGKTSGLAQAYEDVQVVGRVESPYAMPDETNVPVLVLRSPREPLDAIWPRLKHYD